MKIFAVILILGFAWQPSTAVSFGWEDTKKCLLEHGFDDNNTEVSLVMNIGDSDPDPRLKDVSQEKMAAVVACIYDKRFPNKNLFNVLRSLLDRDDKLSEEELKKAIDTLNTCNTNAAGSNAKLLDCLKVLVPPFDRLIAVIRDIPESIEVCFSKCSFTIGELYKMDQNRNKLREVVKYVPEPKLACLLSCVVDTDFKDRPNRRDFPQTIAFNIENSKILDDNQKKEMLETLKRCNDQVAAAQDKTLELIKCLDMFKPPFIDIY